jgi:phosphoribosylaminoimidazolecarboxamide formyltransferase/IMP cyclohydrolase
MTDLVPVRRALLSVSDKSGLEELAAGLRARGRAGLHRRHRGKLRELGHEVRDVSDLTGFPEMMDGRVKTLHPKVHGGLLGVRDNPEHAAAMESTASARSTSSSSTSTRSSRRSRAAPGATRSSRISTSAGRRWSARRPRTTLCRDRHRSRRLCRAARRAGREWRRDVAGLRKRLAAKAFAAPPPTTRDRQQWFAFADQGSSASPTRCRWRARRAELRYGENPHQRRRSTCRPAPHAPGIAQARQVQGKELSYNNLNDADAALELVAEFRDGAPPASSSSTPIRAASRGRTLLEAYEAALACDSVSAFGGIVAVNRRSTARRRGDHRHLHRSGDRARRRRGGAAVFARKKNLRLLLTGELPDPRAAGCMLKSIAGGCWSSRATMAGSPRRAQGGDQARADEQELPTACSPGRSPSTSSRTPSSTPRTAPPPASAPGR